jgi:uncharacterized protein YndB with AHSA1/START domain
MMKNGPLASMTSLTFTLTAIAAAPTPGLARATPADRVLHAEVVVRAPLPAVWHAWTTAEGLAFVSGVSNVELAIGGPYEWFLDSPADERGRRGSEGSRILAYLPHDLLVFSWTFPPETPGLRAAGETTVVVVRTEAIDTDHVRVRLDATGWQEGEEWEAGYAYFEAAWSAVLGVLREHLETAERPTPPLTDVRREGDGGHGGG